MSASREKKLRQDQTASGYVDPKAEKVLEEKKAEKRSNVLYSVIAVLFVLVVAASFLWRSNVISRNATALTIDGEKYSAAEVNFYYQNVYRGFLQSNSYFISYLGLDTNASLKSQTVNATAASMMGVEEGSSWHDYIMDNTVKQMTMVQRGLKQAQEEGYQFPASVQEQYEDSLNSLKTSAESTGMSVKAYLQRNLGAIMTEKVYNQQVLRMLQYQAYAQNYSDSLTYTDAELEAAYQADPKTYDKAAWEYVVVSGAADSTTDADGNTVQATDEEQAAAKETAKATAEEILAAYNSGKSLESIAGNYEKATYYNTTDATYYDGVVGNWLFDDARKDGDTEILEVGTNYYVGLFHSRGREEYKTVDIRHILITPETGTKAQGDEGYEDEQTQLKAAARTKAEEILAQWKSGEATEDSFAQLAMENSADGSKYDGGLYTRVTKGWAVEAALKKWEDGAETEDSFAELANELSSDTGSNTNGGLYTEVYKGQMVTEFNDWCFDASRKDGDTGIVDTTYGSHVMYFVGYDLPAWAASVTSDLQEKAASEWSTALSENADVQQSDFGMKFVG